jgi:redox-sensitive bicupin YhaK (pirin superfamily)
MSPPRYQEVKSADIPVVKDDDGTEVRVVCGNFWGQRGPVEGVAADPIYLDIAIPAGKRKRLPVETGRHVFAYVFAGRGRFSNASEPQEVATETMEGVLTPVSNRNLLLFDNGDEVAVEAGEEGLRFLLVSGRPLGEPVAWRGPIVMNTQDELRRAFAELNAGTFLNPPA